MSKIKILILGSAGMAGHVIKKEFFKYSDLFDVVDIARNNLLVTPTYEMDLKHFQDLSQRMDLNHSHQTFQLQQTSFQ